MGGGLTTLMHGAPLALVSGFGIVAALSMLIVIGVAASALLRRRSDITLKRQASLQRSRLSGLIIQIVLLVGISALGVHLYGIRTAVRTQQNEADKAYAKFESYRQAMALAESRLRLTPYSEDQHKAVSRSLRSNDAAPIADDLSMAIRAHLAGEQRGTVKLQNLTKTLTSRMTEITTDIRETNKRTRDLMLRMTRLFFVGILLSLLSVAAFRFAGKKEEVLAEMREEKEMETEKQGRLINSAPVGVAFRDENGYSSRNPAWQQIFGESSEESPAEDNLAPGELTRLEEACAQATAAGIPFTMQVGLEQEPERRILALNGIPSRSTITENDSPEVIIFARDITDEVSTRQILESKNREIERQNSMLESALGDVEKSFESIVRALVNAVEAKDPYTAGHSERVMRYSLLIGEEMGLSSYDMRILEMGTLVHDVGKIGIPDSVLTKPGRLTDSEFELIKSHPVKGVRILQGTNLFRECEPIVRWHHEKLDGSGYPDGLSGDDIHYLVRIACVADMFDAMTSDRAYRSGMEVEHVMRIIERDRDEGKVDADVVAALRAVINKRGVTGLAALTRLKAA